MFTIKGSIKLFILILCLTVVITAGYNIFNHKVSVGAEKVFNEYMQWENQMLINNPNYEDLKILIDIAEKKLYLLNGNAVIKRYNVASGKIDTPSPIGSWKVINKAKWGGGFGTRWMGINVPWGKYGIHGTNKPNSIGYNASGGCIRMNNRDVEDLYTYVKVGTPVAIVNGAYGPFGYGLNTIQPGDFGSDVMEVQRRLQILGYYNYDYLDGKYGPGMEQALYKFQEDHGIRKNPNITYETFKALGIMMME
ncbi:L,D-transpeptidase family protein [Alkaliphilus serpentinus]|uniref:L,D-transpeptidase family protein n=1 Tax=Alkaliphilus serpentinus TaxID=1482731 RepID=UPI001FAA6628|nr:L,D-transpeptidase family protein [Alkaliphilus serpentinus]